MILSNGAFTGVALGPGGVSKTSLRSPVKEKDTEPEDVVSMGTSEKPEEKPETEDIFKLKEFAEKHKNPQTITGKQSGGTGGGTGGAAGGAIGGAIGIGSAAGGGVIGGEISSSTSSSISWMTSLFGSPSFPKGETVTGEKVMYNVVKY